MSRLQDRSRQFLWHPCTQMKQLETLPPLAIARGEGPWLIDEAGRRYLDAISSWWVNLFGHANPRINAAIVDQLSKIEHVMLAGCTHEPVVQLSERLAKLTGLGHAFYGSDGASATEIALKMSFHFWRNVGKTGKTNFISLQNGYHGETVGALSVTDVALFKDQYAPLLRQSTQVPTPDFRLAEAGESAEEYALRCAEALEAHLQTHADSTAAFILEPLVQGAAGMAMYHPVYLTRARELCTQYGVHLIADEIAVGFGRTGTMFACEQALLPSPSVPHPDPLPEGEGANAGPKTIERGAGGEGTAMAQGLRFADIPAEAIEFARILRKQQTDAETLIWHLLRDRRLAGFKFRRQHPMPPYTVDFYCHEAGLVIELDGGQHADSKRDRKRDEWLRERDLRVLRVWNNDVLQETESVLQAIWNALHEPSRSQQRPHPQPLSPRERGGNNPLPRGEGGRRPGEGAGMTEAAGIRPDFMCLSKGISGGYLPLSCVLTTDEVYATFYADETARGFLHSHSYTGNPLACRAALAVLDIFEEDGVIAANRGKAETFDALLAPVRNHPRVRHFRHRGMIWAFDVADAAPGFARAFAEGALAQGMLLRPIGNTVYCMPPYVVEEEHMAHMARATETLLNTVK